MSDLRSALICLLLAVFAAPALAAERPLIERLVGKDDAVRREARAEWTALDEEGRYRLALASLHSENDDVAWFCADHLDSWRLTLEELRLQASIVAPNVRRYLTDEGEITGCYGVSLGGPEVPAALRAFAALDLPAVCSDFVSTHRSVLPEHVPLLVELLECRDPNAFRTLLAILDAAADFTEQHRETVASGYLYAIARIEAEAAGKPPRPLRDFKVDHPAKGLPEAFLSLARHAWGPTGVKVTLKDEWATWLPSGAWLRRWAWSLTATRKDLPFLLSVIRGGERTTDPARAWAMRRLGEIDDPLSGETLRDLAKGTDVVAELAAGVLARRGEPDRLRALLTETNGGTYVDRLALAYVPDAARRAWFSGETGVWDRPWSWSHDARHDTRMEAVLGVRVPEEALRAFVRQALESDLGAGSLMGAVEDHPELFSREQLEQVVRKVERSFTSDYEEGDWGWEFDSPFYGILEVRAPDLLRRLLGKLAASEHPEVRLPALRALLRLGDGRGAKEILAWAREDWDGYGAEGFWADLGALKREDVREELEKLARSDEAALARGAVVGLAVHHGLEPRLAVECVARWSLDDQLDPQPDWRALRDTVIAGDPASAVVRLCEEYPYDELAAALGRLGGERALAVLRRLRAARKPYWPAVAGLALAGDADAKRELLGFVEDGRTVMFDDLYWLVEIAMEVEPDFIETVLDKLESNCCLRWAMQVGLDERYPTLDLSWEHEVEDRLENGYRARRWYERHRGRFEWSRILGGWVPAE